MPTSLIDQGLADVVVVAMTPQIIMGRSEGPLGSRKNDRVAFVRSKTEGTA